VVHPFYWKPIVSTGVEDLEAAGFRCYPNPANRVVFVEGSQGWFTATLFDISGKQLRQETVPGGRGELSLQGLKPGVYVLQISAASGVYSRRLMVE
jgi:hypothetical protein